MPILESALGIENAFAIAQADESVVALTIGLEDYTADLGVVKTLEGSETFYARQRLVNAAQSRGRSGHRLGLRRRRRHGRVFVPGDYIRARWDSRGWAASIPGRSR